MHVLWVEDSDIDREIFALKLPQTDIAWAGSLAEASQKLASGTYDLVCLDLGLPEATGVETFRLAQDDLAGTPIIVCTGVRDADLAKELRAMGAAAILPKDDVDAAHFQAAVAEALGA